MAYMNYRGIRKEDDFLCRFINVEYTKECDVNERESGEWESRRLWAV